MKGVFPTPDTGPFLPSDTDIEPKTNVARHRHSELVTRHFGTVPSRRRTLRCKISGRRSTLRPPFMGPHIGAPGAKLPPFLGFGHPPRKILDPPPKPNQIIIYKLQKGILRGRPLKISFGGLPKQKKKFHPRGLWKKNYVQSIWP